MSNTISGRATYTTLVFAQSCPLVSASNNPVFLITVGTLTFASMTGTSDEDCFDMKTSSTSARASAALGAYVGPAAWSAPSPSSVDQLAGSEDLSERLRDTPVTVGDISEVSAPVDSSFSVFVYREDKMRNQLLTLCAHRSVRACRLTQYGAL